MNKQPIDEELKRAFRKTILRWEKIVDDVTYYARSNCALCIYSKVIQEETNGKVCVGCPIPKKVGNWGCDGTPYSIFYSNRTTENALRELVFLKNLYIELIDCPKPKPVTLDEIPDEMKKELTELWEKKIEIYERMDKEKLRKVPLPFDEWEKRVKPKEEWWGEAKRKGLEIIQVKWVDITKELKCKIEKFGYERKYYYPIFYYNDEPMVHWCCGEWQIPIGLENTYKIEYDGTGRNNFRILKREK